MKQARLKKYLDSRRISIYALAQEMGLDHGSVSRVINERRTATPETMLKVLDALVRINQRRKDAGRRAHA